MSRAPRKVARTQPPRTASATARLAYEALRPILRLLVPAGLKPVEIETLSRRALRRHARQPVRGTIREGAEETILGPVAAVTSAWRQEPRWTDETGEPRVLPLTGAESFASLLAEVAPSADPKAVLAELRRSRTVAMAPRRRLRLIAKSVVFADPSRFDVPALLTHLRRYAETLELNVLDSRRSSDGLLERSAHAFDLEERLFPEFHRFMRHQLETVVAAGDAQLRKYQVKEPDSPKSAYGFGVYLFRDKPKVRKKKRTRRPSRKRLR
jgi:hypothetical protein